jgi:hypothetical protein
MDEKGMYRTEREGCLKIHVAVDIKTKDILALEVTMKRFIIAIC